MRPLHLRQPSRAAMISVGVHGALLGLLFMAGMGDGPPSFHAPLIEAELITLRAPEIPLPPHTAPSEVPTAVETPAPESEPRPEPEEPASVPLDPSIEVAASEPAAEDEPEAAAPALEPASDGLPTERQADGAEPANATLSNADETVASRDGFEPAANTDVTRQPLASHEELALREKLTSWTGRVTTDTTDSPTLTWREAGQEYTAVLKHQPAADAMSMEQLVVEVTTERDGNRMATELRMNRIAFSNFAQFVDRWDPDVQIHDDVIDGRFHSNSEITVSRAGRVQPLFTGKVTLAARDIRSDGVGFPNRRALFPAGIETSVRRISLPPRAAALATQALPADRVERFDQEVLITFYADGTFGWRPLLANTDEGQRALGEEPFYLLGADGVALHVRGTLNGKALVYTPGRIVITDDLTYADDPRLPNASDYLGLVAERTVEIGEPETTGAGDLEIHASIYARGRFLIRSYRSQPSGTLRLYGSLTAGSLSATEPRFATEIEFDERLTKMRAPGFPLSDRYELDSLSGEWRVLPAD